MCSPSDSNRWAPRLVIVLQLATWSIVGIVLLQRGASSLRAGPPGTPEDHRNTAAQIQVPVAGLSDREIQGTLECQEREAKWTELDRREDANDVRRDDRQSGSLEGLKNSKEDSDNFDHSRNAQNDDTLIKSDSEASVQSTTEPCNDGNARISNRNLRKKMRAARARERIAQEQLLGTGEKKKVLEEDSIKDYFLSVTSSEVDLGLEKSESSSGERGNGTRPGETTPGDARVASSSRGEAPRLKPVDRAGAAAAVAMLAIGVVMLLLAPAIVILRAIDARRRERRLPKLRARKDLPPTYEEATFMDEAPRYSSLHLNTMNDSPETALTIPSGTS